VDLDTGALLAVTLQAADLGDTTTIGVTFTEAQKRLMTVTQALAFLPRALREGLISWS
jgi:hypothetical protein